jgi:hypothetical protein
MRVTQHSGVGLGNARHNDRTAIKEAKEKGTLIEDTHIDLERTNENLILAFDEDYNGYKLAEQSLEEIERAFYEKNYTKALERTNERYIANRHPERCKTIDDLLRDRKPNGQPNKTAPEELILQIGDKDEHPTEKQFYNCVVDYLRELHQYNKEHGNHMHILDVSIHFDEATPHAHIRRVFDYVDEQGLTHIGQAKGLEQMGLELPDPTAPRSRHNNYKMTFDKEMRENWIQICKNHGLEIEEQVKEPGRKHIQEKDQYIAYKQAESEREIEQYKAETIAAYEKTIDSLNEISVNGMQDVVEAIEEYMELPEGFINGSIQKSIDFIAEHKNVMMTNGSEIIKNGLKEDLKHYEAQMPEKQIDYGLEL